jgi:hypothetical protein
MSGRLVVRNPYNGFTARQRSDAFHWLMAEIKEGRRHDAQQCMVCGSQKNPCLHSEDYSFPFGPHIGEYELCWTCHMMIHCRFRNPERWREYMQGIANGFMPAPIRKDFKKEFVPKILGRKGKWVPRDNGDAKAGLGVLLDIDRKGWKARQDKRHGRTQTQTDA